MCAWAFLSADLLLFDLHDFMILFPLLPGLALGPHRMALDSMKSMVIWTLGLPVAAAMARHDRRATAARA